MLDACLTDSFESIVKCRIIYHILFDIDIPAWKYYSRQ